MSNEIIMHENQTQYLLDLKDYLNNYEDINKYKCKTCLYVGSAKKIDFVCTNSLSLYYECDVYKFEGCNFYKKESLEYEDEDGGLFNE